MGLNLLIKPIWVLTEMEVQDMVGHEAWGLYASALSFGFLFLTVADLGINYFAAKTLSESPEQLKVQFPQLMSVKLILLLLYPLLMGLAGYLVGYRGLQLQLLLMLSLVQAGAQMMEFFRANFRAMQRYGLDALLSVFDRLVLLGLVGVLFLTDLTLLSFVHARLIAIGISLLVFYALLVRFYGWLRPRFSWRLVQKLVKGSLPFAAMTILYSIHDKVDQVMLERLVGEVPTGLYAAAYRWLDAFSMYLWIVLPMFFTRFAHYTGDLGQQQRLLENGQLLTGIPLSFICMSGLFWPEKLFFLYDQSTSEAELGIMTSCLQALLVALWINGNLAAFSTLLTSTGHERFVNRLIGVSVLLNVILNALLIPRFGAVASAWATVASFALSGSGYLWYVHWRHPLSVPWKSLGRQAMVNLCLFLGFFAFQTSNWEWWIQVLILAFVYLTLLLLGRMLPISDLVQTLKTPKDN